jgi:hypothetical protein
VKCESISQESRLTAETFRSVLVRCLIRIVRNFADLRAHLYCVLSSTNSPLASGLACPLVSSQRTWSLAVLGVIILSMFWAVVRIRSLHAARAIQDELDTLDNIERKQ